MSYMHERKVDLSLIGSFRPSKRICDLVPPEAPPQPSFKIMRRAPSDRKTKVASQASSVTGDEGDLSDDDASATGSAGGRSNATGNSQRRKWKTIEEREAAYNEARSRIFMGFDEKGKDAEKASSATSSSLSLTSGSNSNAGDSNYGDVDDSASSFAGESEWSAHSFVRDIKDTRRGNRNMRTANGSQGSSRNSRAPSPSFSYASLYEPAPMGWEHHPSAGMMSPPQGYHPSQFGYTYPQPQSPGGHYGPYQFYPPYGPYPPPPPPMPQNVHDPNTSPEMYPPQHPAMGYGYMWPPPPSHMGAPPPGMQMSQPQSPPTAGDASNSSTPASFQPPYLPHAAYSYPMPGYYTPQPGHQPQPMTGMQPIYDSPTPAGPGTSMNGGGKGPHHAATAPPAGDGGFRPNHQQQPNALAKRMPNHTIPMDKPRSAPPQLRGQAWNYGPGPLFHGANNGGEQVGPRLNRRQSSNQSNGSRRSASINDDVSSVAVRYSSISMAFVPNYEG